MTSLVGEHPTSLQPIEFDCISCGIKVVHYWQNPKTKNRCLICRFIQQAPPEDRLAMRRHMYQPEEWGYWITLGCYRDDRYLPAPCEYCKKEFRGPGIYCCQSCAVADA